MYLLRERDIRRVVFFPGKKGATTWIHGRSFVYGRGGFFAVGVWSRRRWWVHLWNLAKNVGIRELPELHGTIQ